MYADKTTNIYRMEKGDYGKLLKGNISKSYKNSTCDVKRDTVDKEASEIAKQLRREERMEKYAGRNAYITPKDHKDNFINNPKCRLINPTKSEVGLLSKQVLKRINIDVRNTTSQGPQGIQLSHLVLDK